MTAVPPWRSPWPPTTDYTELAAVLARGRTATSLAAFYGISVNGLEVGAYAAGLPGFGAAYRPGKEPHMEKMTPPAGDDPVPEWLRREEWPQGVREWVPSVGDLAAAEERAALTDKEREQ